MDAALAVAADSVPDLRSGLFGEWGLAAENIYMMAHQLGSDAPGGAFREPLELFAAGRALIDVIGWRHERAQAEIRIDLGANHLYPTILGKAIASERAALKNHLVQMPRRGSAYGRQSLRRRIVALDELGLAVEVKATQLKSPPATTTRPLSLTLSHCRH